MVFNCEKYFLRELKKDLEERIYLNDDLKKVFNKLIFINEDTSKNEKQVSNRDFLQLKKQLVFDFFYPNFSYGVVPAFSFQNQKISTREEFENFIEKETFWKKDFSSSFSIKSDDLFYLVAKNENWIVLFPLFKISPLICEKTLYSKKSKRKKEKKIVDYEKLFGLFYFKSDKSDFCEIFSTKKLFMSDYRFYSDFQKEMCFEDFLKILKKNNGEKKKNFIISFLDLIEYNKNNPEKLISFFSKHSEESFVFSFNRKKPREIFLCKRCEWETLYLETKNFHFSSEKKFPNSILFFNKNLNLKVSKKFKILINKHRENESTKNKKVFPTYSGSSLISYFLDDCKIDFFDFVKFKNQQWLLNFLSLLNVASFAKTKKNFPFCIKLTFSLFDVFSKVVDNNCYSEDSLPWVGSFFYNDNFIENPYLIKINNFSPSNLSLKDYESLPLKHNIKICYNDYFSFVKKTARKILINKNFVVNEISNNENYSFDNIYHGLNVTDCFYFSYIKKNNTEYYSKKLGPGLFYVVKHGKKYDKFFGYFYHNGLAVTHLKQYISRLEQNIDKKHLTKEKLSKFMFLYLN